MIVYFKCLGFFALWFTFFTFYFFIFFIEYSGKLGVTNMRANCILCHAMKDLWYDCLKSNPMSVLWCKNIRVSLMEWNVFQLELVCPALSTLTLGYRVKVGYQSMSPSALVWQGLPHRQWSVCAVSICKLCVWCEKLLSAGSVCPWQPSTYYNYVGWTVWQTLHVSG